MLKLIYIRNGKYMGFIVRDINHAVALANAIAESDLLNDDIDYNMFDLETIEGELWESEDGETFDEYFASL